MPRKLTMRERGRIGGLTAAKRMTPEERTLRATKAGIANFEKYGKLGTAYARVGRTYKHLAEAK